MRHQPPEMYGTFLKQANCGRELIFYYRFEDTVPLGGIGIVQTGKTLDTRPQLGDISRDLYLHLTGPGLTHVTISVNLAPPPAI